MHTYDFHIGDYARDTLHLSLTEHGIYRLLLDRAYADENPLFSEPETLARKIGARSEKEKKAVETVLNEFFQKTPEGWTHKRVLEELGLAKERTVKAKYSQLCRWWDKNRWPNKPTLTTYLANPSAYHDKHTGHIRQPYDNDTVVSERNTLLPPSAFRLPPTALDTPYTPPGGESSPAEEAASSEADSDTFDSCAGSIPEKKERGGRDQEAIRDIPTAVLALSPLLLVMHRDPAHGLTCQEEQELLPVIRSVTGLRPRDILLVTQAVQRRREFTQFDDIPKDSPLRSVKRTLRNILSEWPDQIAIGQQVCPSKPQEATPVEVYDGPEGWRDIMNELYDPGTWQSAYPNWQLTTPGDREKIKARLLEISNHHP